MQGERNILLVRLKSFGDIVFTLPAVAAVRAAFPQAKITFLTSKELAQLLEGFKEVDTVITVDRARFRGFAPASLFSEAFSLLRKMRANRFSLVIDFQGYGETALLSWCTRAPERWGAVYRPARKWAYTLGVNRSPDLHPAEFNLNVLRQAGLAVGAVRNEFVVPGSALAEARAFFSGHGLRAGEPLLFIQPFTSSPQKNWPLASYLAIAQEWCQRSVQVLFGGGPADRQALEPARAAGFAVAAGAPLLVSAGLGSLATVVLGGDTGLLHLAVAMGKRVVMVMGSTSPGSCHPFGHPDWAVVPPAGAPVASISVEEVRTACRRSLAEAG
jgi:ADP-heptose:LPS heptosyltransferase